MSKQTSRKLTASHIQSVKPTGKAFDVRDSQLPGFMVRVTAKGRMSYVYQYRFGGRQSSFTIGPVDEYRPDDARALAWEIRRKISKGIDPADEKRQTRKEQQAQIQKQEFEQESTFAGFVNGPFEEWALAHRKRGQYAVDRLLANHRDWHDRSLTDINPLDVERFIAKRKKQGRMASTINRDVGDLRCALNKAEEWGLLDFNPACGIAKLAEPDREPRFLTHTESQRLMSCLKQRDEDIRVARRSHNEYLQARSLRLFPDMDACSYPDKLTPIIHLALNTGMRRGEIFALKWRRIDFSNKRLTVDGASSKTGKSRIIELNRTAMSVLFGWRGSAKTLGFAITDMSYVFQNDQGKKLTHIRRSWGRLRKLADLEDFRFHDFRHTFASNLVMADVPLNTVRDLLGHSSIEMTLKYAHLSPSARVNAVEKIVGLV